MLKKVFLIIFSFAIALTFISCDKKEKSESELISENVLFSQALKAEESFIYNDITFKITNVFVTFSFNEDNPEKTIKVYVDYPYEIKTVEYSHFSVIDPNGDEYKSVLPDGLDFMGQYRLEGEEGNVSFIVPSKYDNFLLKLQMFEEPPVYVWFNLNNY